MKPVDTRTIDVESLENIIAPPLLGTSGERQRLFHPPSIGCDFITGEAFGLTRETPTGDDLCLPTITTTYPAHGIKPRLRALLAATLIDFVPFSPRADRTRGVETAQLINAIQLRRRASVTVSEALRIPREKMLASSLFAPSGAYLTWLAMDTEDGDE